MIAEAYDTHSTQPVRGTQQMVDHMGWVFRRSRITLLEIAWRWIFAIPFLWICWGQMQLIAVALPPDRAGVDLLNTQNPWIDGVQLGAVWMRYVPYIVHALYWLLPAGLVAWSVMAGLGRGLVLRRIEPHVDYRPLPIMFLQGCWLALLLATFLAWYECIQWIAATHIRSAAAPDLVGYSIWVIFVSLGLFILWAVISWPFIIAPILALKEQRSALSALVESFRLGRSFTAELIEINLTMGIVKLMLLVLAMVFSASPLPFAQEVGSSTLHAAMAASTIFYCLASDYFQVVRLKAFVEFWHTFRGHAEEEAHPGKTTA